MADTIDERIVSRDYVVDRQRSATIKNAMRDRCVGDIVNAARSPSGDRPRAVAPVLSVASGLFLPLGEAIHL